MAFLIFAGLLALLFYSPAAAVVTNTSSFGVVGTHQKANTDEATEGFYSVMSQRASWIARTPLEHSGDITFAIIGNDSESNRSAQFTERFEWKRRRLTSGIVLEALISRSQGTGFLSLNDQFDRNQSLQTIGDEDELKTTQWNGQANLQYRMAPQSTVSYALTQEHNNNESLSATPQKQSIDLESHSIDGSISLAPHMGFAFTARRAILDITQDSQELTLDTQQEEIISQALLVLQPTRLTRIAAGVYQQLVKAEQNRIVAVGPQANLSHQFSRNTALDLTFTALKISFEDQEELSFTNNSLRLSHQFNRTKDIALSYEKRLDTASDVYELFNTRGDELPMQGSISESSQFTFNQRWRRLTHQIELTHTTLFSENDRLSFQETTGQNSIALRVSRESTMEYRFSLRQQKDFVDEQLPTTQIFGLEMGYRLDFVWESDIKSRGNLAATLQTEMQRDNIQNQIRRTSMTINATLLF